MDVTYTMEKGEKLTEAQLQEVFEAKKHPSVFDEDCPELSPELYKAFQSAVANRNRQKRM